MEKIVGKKVVETIKTMEHAKLRILFGGEEENKVFTLGGDETLIGRGDESDIQISHSSVSRRHCSIIEKDDGYFIEDLESLNGTFIGNDVVAGTRMQHGDKIRIGDFVAVFESNDEIDSDRFCEVDLDEGEMRLPKDSLFLTANNSEAANRDLTGLLNITKKINVLYDIEELQGEILSQIFEVVPATEGAIILVDENQDFTETVGLNRFNANEPALVSKTVVRQVLDEKKLILAKDVISDTRVIQSESLAIAGTLSLLCVPLINFDKTLGVIYLTTNDESASFDKGHLRFANAISSIASVAIENARNFSWLKDENRRLKAESVLEQNMIGESSPMKKVYEFIGKIAPVDSTVLIGGESGTGKELAARSIHANSLRKDEPFVAINCTTLNENLLESELFGHEKGAFTGATSRKKGKIESANGGTLFLDEIGELAVPLQAKLLRVIQEREFERVGGTKLLNVDIRLIVATNRDLEEEVANGNFRRDLFYRLNVIKLTMPPLRERKDDILLLAETFLKKCNHKIRRPIRGLSVEVKEILRACEFAGNVRELENAIEYAVVIGSNEWILPEDLPEDLVDLKAADGIESSFGKISNLQEGIREKKKELIHEAFQQASGNYVETAKILDVHPNYLHRLIRVLGIKAELKADLSVS